MLRAVLSVAVAAALLGVALPAADRAAVARSQSALAGEAEALSRAAERLAAGSDPVPADARGARTVVGLRLPGRSWSTAAVDYFAVGAAPRGDSPDGPAGDVVAYRVAGGRERRVRLSVDVRAARNGHPAPEDRPLVVGEPGRHALVLRLARVDGHPVVLVGRPGAERDGASERRAGGRAPARHPSGHSPPALREPARRGRA